MAEPYAARHQFRPDPPASGHGLARPAADHRPPNNYDCVRAYVRPVLGFPGWGFKEFR